MAIAASLSLVILDLLFIIFRKHGTEVTDPPVVADPLVVPPMLCIIYNNAVIPFEQSECPICLNNFVNLEELRQISS